MAIAFVLDEPGLGLALALGLELVQQLAVGQFVAAVIVAVASLYFLLWKHHHIPYSCVALQIQQLQNEWAVADTARLGYQAALRGELLKSSRK